MNVEKAKKAKKFFFSVFVSCLVFWVALMVAADGFIGISSMSLMLSDLSDIFRIASIACGVIYALTAIVLSGFEKGKVQ